MRRRKPCRLIIKGVFYNFHNEYYFGHCLYKDHKNFHANLGEENWFYCPRCKIKWRVGWGLSFEPPECIVEDINSNWEKNKILLKNYEDCSLKNIWEW